MLTCEEEVDSEYELDPDAQRPVLADLERIHRCLRGEGDLSILKYHKVEPSSVYGPAKTQLERQLRIRLPQASDGRDEFIRKIGIHDLCDRPEVVKLNGPLDELRASNVSSGYFRIRFTENPVDHLKFDDLSDHPQIKMLKLANILNIYVTQCVGLTAYGHLHIKNWLIKIGKLASPHYFRNCFILMSSSLLWINPLRNMLRIAIMLPS